MKENKLLYYRGGRILEAVLGSHCHFVRLIKLALLKTIERKVKPPFTLISLAYHSGIGAELLVPTLKNSTPLVLGPQPHVDLGPSGLGIELSASSLEGWPRTQLKRSLQTPQTRIQY